MADLNPHGREAVRFYIGIFFPLTFRLAC